MVAWRNISNRIDRKQQMAEVCGQTSVPFSKVQNNGWTEILSCISGAHLRDWVDRKTSLVHRPDESCSLHNHVLIGKLLTTFETGLVLVGFFFSFYFHNELTISGWDFLTAKTIKI